MERVPRIYGSPRFAKSTWNHKKWFLQHHENALMKFEESVASLYGLPNEKQSRQLTLLEERDECAPPERNGGDDA